MYFECVDLYVSMVDLSHPSLLMTNSGAAVTQIDPPSGPRWKSNANTLLNRGKTCIQLDFKSVAGCAHAWQLVRKADVVVGM